MEKIIGLLVTLFILIMEASSFAEIEIKYDKFKNRTVVQTDPKKIAGTVIQPALVLIGSYDGQTPSRPAVCIIAFSLTSSSWAYLRCHSLNCLADGKPVELPPSEHHGSTERGYVIEHVAITIPFSFIEQLSKCEKIEFKLCNTEFSLSRYEMQDLKTFVEAFLEKK
jgi:hypothetical protein